MKFKKPTKPQLKNAATSVVAGGLGFFGTSYGRAKLVPKLQNYGGQDAYDLGVTVVGISAAASASGNDLASKTVRGIGVGAALNSLYSLTVRKLAKYKPKKTKGSNMPIIEMPAQPMALNQPVAPVVENLMTEEVISASAMSL